MCESLYPPAKARGFTDYGDKNSSFSPITKTVYSVAMPETHQTFKEIISQDNLTDMYSETWTKKQDTIHLELFNTFSEYVAPRLSFNLSSLKHQYPSAGSSEALREQICYLHSQGKRLVVFHAEYEGYIAIAQAIGMPFLKINRFVAFEQIQQQLKLLNSKTDVFFISEPSSIDGFHWQYIQSFLQALTELEIPIYIDLTYIGAYHFTERLNLTNLNIYGVFFSLSKIFGVYYHRIGGVFLKDPNPLLYGNMWFKNLLSIKYGITLMQKYPIGFFDRRLYDLQDLICYQLSQEYFTTFVPADVFLLSNVKYQPNQFPWQKELQRDELNPNLRLCISPKLENFLKDYKIKD